MASFPTSVKTFTTKQDGPGNSVFAAHVNDIQDEVNAIEAGYLQASARLNSSHSTVAALSVSGGSTLAGVLNVAELATFSSIVRANTQPRVRCVSTSVQAIPANTTTTFTFEHETFDVGGWHSTAANADQFTVPTGSSGLYWLNGYAPALTQGALGDRSFQIAVRKNGTPDLNVSRVVSSAATEGLAINGLMVLDAADVITFASINGGSTVSFGTTSSNTGLRFELVRLW